MKRGSMENAATRCVWDVGARLGEGPVWDARDAGLWFVDIEAPAIHRYGLADARRDRFTPPWRVSAIWPRAAGGFVAHGEAGFATIDPAAGRYDLFHATEPERPGNRSNDGKIDPAGRFWSGTMDDAKTEAVGALYRLDPDRRVTRIDDGYHITNGPAFSPDGRTMYHTDTLRRTVYAFDIAADGSASGKRDFLSFGDETIGNPDGMTIDSDGCLWIAFWGGWCVRRYAPDGAPIGECRVPALQVTSLAFAGTALDRLFVTSAADGLERRAEHALAGALFEIVDPGATGVAMPLYAG
ncbi:MAG: SMP-30/gluconolactonase/LRE family protein [Sphingomonadaceae bacterium]|nr:SMP-30/gluconolactonase/LRE family protein [Sphingomonadaceae bacterium]